VAKARKLAELYKRPLALFYLAQPPQAYDVLRDFRRLPGTFRRRESPELLWAVRQARHRRKVALDLLAARGQAAPVFSGSATIREDPEHLGARMRRFLGVSVDAQKEFGSPHEALRAWRDSVEARGVLIFQATRIDVQEMRALCLPEDRLPAILLNGADHPHGRIFSLLHELVHLYLARGGVLGEDGAKQLLPEDQRIEVFANAAAASALLPAHAFGRDPLVSSESPGSGWPDPVLAKLSKRFSVSREVIFRRLVTLGLSSDRLYEARRVQWEKEQRSKPRQKADGAPPVPVRVLSQVGRSFARIVLDSYSVGSITLLDLSDYLGMKPKWLPQFERQLAGGLVSRRGA